MYVQVFHLIRIKESLCKNTILIVKYFNESTVIQVHVCLTYFLIDTCMFSKILKKYIYKKKTCSSAPHRGFTHLSTVIHKSLETPNRDSNTRLCVPISSQFGFLFRLYSQRH